MISKQEINFDSICYMSMFDFNGKNNLHWGDYQKKMFGLLGPEKPLEKIRNRFDRFLWCIKKWKRKKNVIFLKKQD